MASGGVPYEEHFCCCICLDLFISPVTLPCGHNFCKVCISQHWSSTQSHQCALCREHFPQNTELRVNTVLAQMSHQLRSSAAGHPRRGEGAMEREEDVWCDVCTERRAQKSCVTCLTSFCEAHLEPHYQTAGLRRHQLIEPARGLEQRTCTKHNRPLRFFCQTDQTCVCQFCSESDHSRHAVVSLEQGGEEKRRELSLIQDTILGMALDRRTKMNQLRQAARDGEDTKAESIRDCVQAVSKVTRGLETGLSRLIDALESEQGEVEARARCMVLQLEEEICQLMCARLHLEDSKSTNDDFKLIQDFEALKILPATQDLSKVEARTFRRSVVEEVVKTMRGTVESLDTFWREVELRCARQSAADVTLDADTASPALILSDDCKQVKCGDVRNEIRTDPERFAVLGKEFVESGKFYFEVRVGQKERWGIGVVLKSMERERPELWPENSYWVVWLSDGEDYCASADRASVKLNPRDKPQTVGVLVDYDKGAVAFYNSETAEKIHAFESREFQGRLYPYFSPGLSDGRPLIVTAVN